MSDNVEKYIKRKVYKGMNTRIAQKGANFPGIFKIFFIKPHFKADFDIFPCSLIFEKWD